MVRRALRPLLLLALALAPVSAGAETSASPPAELADRFSAQLLAAAKRANARAVRVDLQGDPSLEGAPALVAISRELENALFGAGRLSPAGGATPADLEIVATLSRVRGQVALGGAVTARGVAVDWVLVSSEEVPAWWPWLAAVRAAPPAASGFVWRRAGSLPGIVEDADAGDLDGDGAPEFVAATGTELLVFRAGELAPALAARIGLDDGAEPAEVATRAPRSILRVSMTAGGPEILLRRTDEKNTRVYGWEAGRLVRRADRDGVTLATRLLPRGLDVVSADSAAGTNRFLGPPRLRRGMGAARTLDDVPWIDFRPAAAGPVAAISETAAQYGWLDAGATLHLLRADGGELARVAHCGAAYALADLDGDGAADAICSADAPPASDRLSVHLSGGNLASVSWSTPLDGGALAIAAAPSTGVLVFVAGASDESEVWILRSPR